MKFIKSKIPSFVLLLFVFSCVEPFEIEKIDTESLLVVEASLTNKLQRHTVKLSKTFAIDESQINAETGAQVSITSTAATYLFNEVNAGEYISETRFSAAPNMDYTLRITTKDGKSYASKSQQLTANNPIEKLSISVENSTDNERGVSISVQSTNSNTNGNYYRFKYEETQKITAPLWSNQELRIVSDRVPFRVEVIDRRIDNKDCYATTYSDEIILAETKSLSEDSVDFPVRFILDSDFIISSRYSILVKQYVQTFEAYQYYKTLKKLSSSESVFNQAQPGFINGNIFSTDNTSEKVIGFFEVNAVSEKRIFLNYKDLFPENSIAFPYSCELEAPLIFDGFTGESPLVDLLKSNTHTYYKPNDTGLDYLEGPYLLVPKICGDCTVLGSNIKPSFWVD